MSTEDQLQSNVVIFSVSVMKNIEKSTDSISSFGPGDAAFLERLAVHPSYRVRRVVAEMNDLPLCLEKQLAEDAFASVRNRLTQRAAEKAAND